MSFRTNELEEMTHFLGPVNMILQTLKKESNLRIDDNNQGQVFNPQLLFMQNFFAEIILLIIRLIFFWPPFLLEWIRTNAGKVTLCSATGWAKRTV